jgi:hypothetical protein
MNAEKKVNGRVENNFNFRHFQLTQPPPSRLQKTHLLRRMNKLTIKFLIFIFFTASLPPSLVELFPCEHN